MTAGRPAGAWRVILVAAVLAAPRLAAQQATGAGGDSTPPAPRPIPADSIPAHARAAAAALASLRGRLPADSVLGRRDSLLRELQDAYAETEAIASPERLNALFFEQLTELDGRWRRLQRRLAGWREQTDVLAADVEAGVDTLTRISGRWQATRAESWADLPRAVRAQVTEIRRSVDSALAAARPVRDRLLAVQGEGAQLDADVGTRMDEVQAATERARRQVLRQDSPVLWKVFTSPRPAAADTVGEIERVDRFEGAAEYLLRQPGRVRFHLLIFVAITLALWAVSRRRDAWATAEFALHWPSNLLAHPVAAGWLAALVATRFIHPGAPAGVYGLAFLLMVPALVILLRRLLSKPLRAPAFVVVGLDAVRVLADTFAWHPTAARFTLLTLGLAGGATFLWFARLASTGAPGREAFERWRRFGQAVAYAGAGLQTLGVVANLLGFVTLAGMLVGGTLVTGLAALALLALVEVVTGALLVVLFATPVGRMEVLRRNREAATRQVASLVHVGGFVLWSVVALRQFRLLGPVLDLAGTALRTPLTLGSWNLAARDVLLFAVTLWVSILIARGLRAVLRDDVLPRMDLGRGVPAAAASIVYYLALALGLVFAAGAAGIDVGRLTIIVGALGVGIGFGLQNIVANFISGLILLFERPIKSGDTVELEGLLGTVQDIGIRASTVRTFQGADVIVPNQDLVAGRVINWTLSDQIRRVDVPVGVAYGSDPDQVMTVLREAAVAHGQVLPDPAPTVLFMKYGDSSLDFELRFWAPFDDWLRVRSDVLVAIYRSLAERGIEIPFPQRDLHLRTVDATVQDVLRRPDRG